MKLMPKLLCCLLAILMVLTVLCACTPSTPDNPDNPDNPNTPDNPDNPDNPDEDIDYLATLPKKDFNDEAITVLCRTDKLYEIWAEEDSADTMEAAVFNRNSRVEEWLGVTLEHHDIDGVWSSRDNFKTAVINANKSGNDDYQIVAGYLAYISDLAASGEFYNLHNVDSLKKDAAWWSQSFVENNTVYDCLFFVDGDYSLTMWEGLYGIFFNKQMAQDNGLTDLYQIVRDGDWTLETFEDIVNGIYVDNGNDARDEFDTYGLLMNRHALRTMVTTSGCPVAARDDYGGYVLNLYSEKLEDLYANLYHFIYQEDGTYFYKNPPGGDGDYSGILTMFKNNQALFLTSTLDNASSLRSMDTEFGILPFPKYDDLQENYLAHSFDGHSIFCIPAQTYDPEMVGTVLDALSAESKYSVIPTYYDKVLKGRSTTDNESKEMLDIIRDHLYFDFGYVHSNSMTVTIDGTTGGPFASLGDRLQVGDATYSTYYQKAESAFKTALEKVMREYERASAN